MKKNNLSEKPMVSILMITYNHEKYIRQALDGILMQKVDFTYEVVIGEDCSQDNTRAILLEYKEKYPDRIRLILHEKNVGIGKNLGAVQRQCDGKYVAICEGDDYWTDPYKLKKQVSFLENHPEYIGTAHKIQVVDEYGNFKKDSSSITFCQDEVYTIKHVEKGLLPGQTATLVYRNLLINDLTAMDALENCNAIGDRKIALYLALNGNIYCFNEVMSHYRHVTEHGDSWNAKTKGKNLALYTINYNKELSLLAKELKNMEVDFTAVNLACGMKAFLFFLKKPNLENFEILKEIYANHNNKITMTSYILKKVIGFPFKKMKRYILKSNNF